jgi:hypothetical protein
MERSMTIDSEVDPLDVEETLLPRFVMFRGRKVRITRYYHKTETQPARFVIVDTDDRQRTVYRQQITFIKEKKK